MRPRLIATLSVLLFAAPLLAGWKVIAWNDLGMHCTDGVDYATFGVLPPYNTIHAQVIDANGKLVRDASSVRVTYEAVADATGSINATSAGKTNFWTFVKPLFGAAPPVDTGLAGKQMPGTTNVPQAMDFDTAAGWFTAEGVPITPYDDGGRKNYYPMMRVVVRSTTGALLASSDVVLPVSDEMDCSSCHAPTSTLTSKEVILMLHDVRHAGSQSYTAALARAGYAAAGLSSTVKNGMPILCARCHTSNALPGTGFEGIAPLTQAIHAHHANVVDPINGTALGASANRSACYRCHPGASTRCLRGVMGRAAGSDGHTAIQCQNCHGSMSDVGVSNRQGWFDEPTCQQCHTGTATANAGAIRFANVFSSPGVRRTTSNTTFATNTGAPSAGLSLFRFSKGHGGLYCSACHGSPHAEFPSSEANDNVQSAALQGHEGVIGECGACHATTPSTTNGGPHGMHPAGAAWVSRHGDVAERGTAACQPCHGADLRGTVLSRTYGDRTISAMGSHTFWRGYTIGCWACHNGPSSESTTRVSTPTTVAAAATGRTATSVTIPLSASDSAGSALTLRVVQPPKHGTAGIAGTSATYISDAGFAGRDSFTFAASNGYVESQLATVTIDVSGPAPKRRSSRHP